MKSHKVFRELGAANAKAAQDGGEMFGRTRRMLASPQTTQVMDIGRRGGHGDARQRQVYRKRGLKGNDYQTLAAMLGKERAKYGMHGEQKLHVPGRAA